jgi:RNA polymerase sigma-70 factor (ECF subfamily)
LNVGDAEWVQHLATRLPPAGDLREWVSKVQVGDLYLAHACASGDPVALDIFEREMLPQLAPAIAEIESSESFIAEVEQQLRRKLLVREGANPGKIAEYAGFGRLVHWLRVVAVRTALNLRRTQNRGDLPVGDDALLELPVQTNDIELDYLKSRYREDFAQAFKKALNALTSQERNVLRLHFVDGLSMGQVGAAYQADKSTVSRWIAKSRRTLLEETRRELAERLHLDGRELDSIMRLVHSQLDLSISTVLRGSKD